LNSSFVYSSSIRNSPSTSNPSCHHSAVPGTQSLPSTPSPPRTSPLPPHSRLSSLAPESRPQYPSPISLCTRLALPLSVEWWLLLEEKEKKDDGVKVEDVAPPPPPLLGAVVDVPCEGERWKTLRSQERVRWRREMLVPGEEVAVLDDGVGDGMVRKRWWTRTTFRGGCRQSRRQIHADICVRLVVLWRESSVWEVWRSRGCSETDRRVNCRENSRDNNERQSQPEGERER
ncbi:hypothetical protein IWX50DRAFT_688567, partial [Phyllosticta citricarpa]